MATTFVEAPTGTWDENETPRASPLVIAVVEAPGYEGASLARIVRAGGHEVVPAKDHERVRVLLRKRQFDAVVAHVEGLDPIRRLAAVGGSVALPVVVVADSRLVHPGEALDTGADDVVSIPIDPQELLARLRAVVRRSRPRAKAPLVVSTPDFTIDLSNRICWGPDGEVHLTGIEWQLVDVLCRRPGRLVGAQHLLGHIWGRESASRPSLRVHVYDLRKKLEPDPHRPRYFRTEPGVGMRFVPGEARAE